MTEITMTTKLITLDDLYQYFDQLLDQENDDLLFASSYLRGFIPVEAVAFGDDQQKLSAALATKISEKLTQARTELSPQDRTLVTNLWIELSSNFVH
jgi:hypothetical protein